MKNSQQKNWQKKNFKSKETSSQETKALEEDEAKIIYDRNIQIERRF